MHKSMQILILHIYLQKYAARLAGKNLKNQVKEA